MKLKSDDELKRDVQAELSWDVRINDSAIIVSADGGVITLGGHVPFHTDKVSAERAAKHIAGVRAVANDIEVRPGSAGQRSDSDIAAAAIATLKSNVSIPADRIQVVVREASITLEGNVPFGFQKEAAENAVRVLWRVKEVINSIKVEPPIRSVDIRAKIQSAFQRHAALDANKVKIAVDDGTVTLDGHVHSWLEKDDAENAAWSAPGVNHIKNNLSVANY